MASLEERIDRGVLFLDQTIGNWRERIDLITLDLSDPAICVLGQVFREELPPEGRENATGWRKGEWAVADFEEDAELLDDQEELTYAHVGYGFERVDNTEPYEDLQKVWVQRILHG